MQLDFHYYATYCAASLAGFSVSDSQIIACSAQFVDCCTRALLSRVGGPLAAATTQMQLELMDARTDPAGLLDITGIWASFHFLPGNLDAVPERGGKKYRRKYRLICDTNGELLKETVELARGKGPAAAGLAMHVLADTWAHRYFAGTPSLVINNTNYHFFEILDGPEGEKEIPVRFNHNPASADYPEKSLYTNTVYQGNENSIMNLGHGRAGHLPDYSFARYRYMPAWDGYREVIKDNPSDYMHAFCQMAYALQCLNGGDSFDTGVYAWETVKPWREEINSLLIKRQMDACEDWKSLGEKISGIALPDFDLEQIQVDYMETAEENRENTFLGRFIPAALAQKAMVTGQIAAAEKRQRRMRHDKK